MLVDILVAVMVISLLGMAALLLTARATTGRGREPKHRLDITAEMPLIIVPGRHRSVD